VPEFDIQDCDLNRRVPRSRILGRRVPGFWDGRNIVFIIHFRINVNNPPCPQLQSMNPQCPYNPSTPHDLLIIAVYHVYHSRQARQARLLSLAGGLNILDDGANSQDSSKNNVKEGPEDDKYSMPGLLDSEPSSDNQGSHNPAGQ